MSGILYGVGVGPGDPELMTIKSVRIIKENEVIALPGQNPKETIAYKIAVQSIPELAQKELLPIPMPMTGDKAVLSKNHKSGAQIIEKYLQDERNVVFLCLGDPAIYSTYAYIAQILNKEGYKTQMINGIPSFCAAASRANLALTMWDESLEILPAVHTDIQCKNNTNYIFMKAGKSLSRLKAALSGSDKDLICIENCGMETEHIYYGINEIPDEAGYYTLLIVKNKLS